MYLKKKKKVFWHGYPHLHTHPVYFEVMYKTWAHDCLRKAEVHQIIQSYQRSPGTSMVRGFSVNYKRHVLTMDDLSTLYGQNWLNDQVLSILTTLF